MWMEETVGKRINVTRVEQALPQSPKIIATACPYCAGDDGGCARGRRPRRGDPTRDIAELVAEGMVRKPAGATA